MDYDYDLYDNDISDQYSNYYGDLDEEEKDVGTMTVHQVYELCLKTTVFESARFVFPVLLSCLVYRLSTQIFVNSSSIHHIISLLTGLLSLHSVFSTSIYYIISLVLYTYILLFGTTYFQYKKNRGFFLILTSICYLCICELWLVNPKQWHRIRGSQMIIVMKCVSLAFDLDIGKVKKLPNLICYSGYMLCPSSSVFGPWISFTDYETHRGSWSFKVLQKIIIKLLLAFLFLSISICWAEYFIPLNNWKWFSAYRDALSFRTSHYFISYLSEVTLLLSGYSSSTFNGVTSPLYVEFPKSLVNVVIYWNMPMHNWLKIYVFNTSRRFGNFNAVLLTYAVSSLLHGLSFQLSAVLLSLGVYSYVEVKLRKKLAGAFNACILAKGCKSECSHHNKAYHPFVLLTNLFFALLTVFHLAYLGVVFESSQQEETGYDWRHCLKTWSNLDYLSHYVAFLTYVMYFLIR